MSNATPAELFAEGKVAIAAYETATDPVEKQQHLEEANRLFLEVVRAEPDNVEALVFVGLTNMDLGDDDGARAALEKALELDPNNTIAQRALANLTAVPPPPDQQQPNLDPQPASRDNDGIIDDDDDPPARRWNIPRWLLWTLGVLLALALLLWWSPWRSWTSGNNAPNGQIQVTSVPELPQPSPTPAQAGQLPTTAPAATARPTNAIPTTTGPTVAPTNTPTRPPAATSAPANTPTRTPTATIAPTNTPTRTPAATIAPTAIPQPTLAAPTTNPAAYPAPLSPAAVVAPTVAPIAPGTTAQSVTGDGTMDNPFTQTIGSTQPFTSSLSFATNDGLAIEILEGNGDVLLTWRDASGKKVGDVLIPANQLTELRQIDADAGQTVSIMLIPSSNTNLKVRIKQVLAVSMAPTAGDCDDYESCKDD